MKANYKVFNTFETGYIKGGGRADYNEVYFIDNQYLTKLNIDDKNKLEYNASPEEKKCMIEQ